MMGCDKKPADRADSPDAATPVSTSSEMRTLMAPPPPKMAGRVYVDVSTGMKGFAAAPKTTALRALHGALDVAMSEAGAPTSPKCTVGIRQICVKYGEDDAGKPACVAWGPTPPIECAAKPPDLASSETYSAGASSIDVPFVRQPRPEKYDPDKPPPGDPLDEAKLTVIVTSSPAPGAKESAAESLALACKQGPTPGCLSAALQARAAEDYGIWVIGALLAFDGTFVANVTRDPVHLNEVRDHLKEIKAVAAGAAPRFSSVTFKIDPAAVQPQDAAQSAFRFSGVRPVLVFALSRDVEMGRRFVASFTSHLSAESALRPGAMTSAEIVRSVELAPLHAGKYKLKGLERAAAAPMGAGNKCPDPLPVGTQCMGQTELTEFGPLKDVKSDANGVSAKVSCGAKGKSWVLAEIEESSPATLPPFVTQIPVVLGPRTDQGLPERVGFPPERVEGQNKFKLGAACGPLTPRSAPWVVEYELRRELKVDAEKTGWLADWTSPDAYHMPERAHGLREIALAVVKKSESSKTAFGRIRFDIERRE